MATPDRPKTREEYIASAIAGPWKYKGHEMPIGEAGRIAMEAILDGETPEGALALLTPPPEPAAPPEPVTAEGVGKSIREGIVDVGVDTSLLAQDVVDSAEELTHMPENVYAAGSAFNKRWGRRIRDFGKGLSAASLNDQIRKRTEALALEASDSDTN